MTIKMEKLVGKGKGDLNTFVRGKKKGNLVKVREVVDEYRANDKGVMVEDMVMNRTMQVNIGEDSMRELLNYSFSSSYRQKSNRLFVC